MSADLGTAARSDAKADRSLVFYPPSPPPTAQNVRARALARVSARLLMSCMLRARAGCVCADRLGVCHRARIGRFIAGVVGRPTSIARWPLVVADAYSQGMRARRRASAAPRLCCVHLAHRARRSPAARARAVSTQRVAADRMAPRTVEPLHTMNRLDRTSCMMGACTVLTLLMWQISLLPLPWQQHHMNAHDS